MKSAPRSIFERWWLHRIHPLTRVGWHTATAGTTRPASQTIIGIGLMVAGAMLKRQEGRTVLYRGRIEPGKHTRIRVLQGTNVIHESSLEA